MENWITPTVIATIVTAVFTYMGTKRTSRSEIDQVYLPYVDKAMKEFDEKVDKQNKKIAELERKLNAKDELIAELRKEIKRLETENKELKGETENG